jgi:dTDP-6-deoxy-L-talose 4-dehydrogenase (NAD+)
MTVAVTGAPGFIGRHVVTELKHQGVAPTLVCRPGSELPAPFAGAPVVWMDLADPPADAFDQLGRPETVIHLAWGGLPQYRSSHHLDRELPAQLAFLGSLVRAGLDGLTVTGTCFEYGMQSGALAETTPTAPVTTYGQAKDRLRQGLEALQQSHRFRLTWVRLFYLYGEGQAPGSLLPQLEAAIARGDATFNMSGGEQLRDYLPVDEAARAVVALARNGRDNGVVNVCAGSPISVRELAERVVARHRSPIRLNLGYFPYLDYEPMAYWGDRGKLDDILGRDRGRV